MTILTLGRRRLNLSLRIEDTGAEGDRAAERAYLVRELRATMDRERLSQELNLLTRPRTTF